MNEFWLILFSVVLIFDLFREQQFIFIYYTIWTFTLETIFFALLVAKQELYASKLFPFIYAPSLVVCIGFWILIAPISSSPPQLTNMVLTVVTHGLNMIAMVLQPYKIHLKDVWKPVFYTVVYNIFLAVYVGIGGRSISGNLPYWYTQYDKAVGWVFAGLAILAVSTVHVFCSSKRPPKIEPFIV